MTNEYQKLAANRSSGKIVIDAIGFVECADSLACQFIPKLYDLDEEFVRIADLFVDKIEFDSEIGLINSTRSRCLGWHTTLNAYGKNRETFEAELSMTQNESANDEHYEIFVSKTVRTSCNCQKQNVKSDSQHSGELENQIEHEVKSLIEFAESAAENSKAVCRDHGRERDTILNYQI